MLLAALRHDSSGSVIVAGHTTKLGGRWWDRAQNTAIRHRASGASVDPFVEGPPVVMQVHPQGVDGGPDVIGAGFATGIASQDHIDSPTSSGYSSVGAASHTPGPRVVCDASQTIRSEHLFYKRAYWVGGGRDEVEARRPAAGSSREHRRRQTGSPSPWQWPTPLLGPGIAGEPGPHVGLIQTWRHGPAGWEALVVYVLVDNASDDVTTVQTWMPADSTNG